MKHIKLKQWKHILVLSVGLAMVGTITEGCHGKKCGCMHDLNGVYKRKKRNW